MSIEAWRWWRVEPENGRLRSLFMETPWDGPVMAAEYPVLEVYHVKIVEAKVEASIVGFTYALGEILESPNVWGKEKLLLPVYDKNYQLGQVIEHMCASGVHALRERELDPIPSALGWWGKTTFVSGAVRLFGHIVEHERGWRAEKALVSGPLVLYKEDEALAKRIATRYDCEVTCTKESPYGPGEDDPRIR